MAIFKCKMCGGALEIMENATVVCCDYCGTQQTLPKLDDERRANLYDRANHFRRSNEFDKAMGIYEQILNEDKTDAEAYWSLVLCRFGIEYVEDPATRKRVPTVNRAQLTSIFNDENYKSALQYADGYQRHLYEEEAKAINEIQKGILAISQKEEPFDVFICYKETDNNGRRTPDSVLANDLYHQLTREGFKVFFARITLEDKLGTAYEPYIFAALNSAKVMVVLGTKPEYFNAVWVKNEWSRYLALIKQGANKVLVPAYKDMDPYDLPEEFSHLQAQDMSKLGFMQDLIHGIKKIAKADEPKTTVVRETVSVGNANTNALLKRAFMFLEDGDFKAADEYCEKVLDIDPENGLAYLGKLMAELNVRNQKGLLDCAEPFDSSNNYQKAIRFGDEKIKTALTSYTERIKYRNAYNEARSLMAIAKTEEGYKKAADAFEAISNYEDSASLAEECLERAENVRKDAVFYDALAKVKGSVIKDYEVAIELFKTIPGWRDADSQIERCQKQIEKLKAEAEHARLERERKAEQDRIAQEKRAKQRKIIMIATAVATFVIIAVAVLVAEVFIPNAKYNDAVELMDAGNVVEAYEALVALDGYKDSADKANSIYDQYKVEKLKIAKAGDYVFFGAYEQDNNTSNGKEDVEWLVLEIKDGKALVISKYALVCKPYSYTDVTWETCSLRKWLNNDFINSAFSADEKAMIPTVTVSADKNPNYSTNPGNATQDKVFLLSITEANKYFSSDSARQCKPTDYAVANGAWESDSGNCWWWLRSPGYKQNYAAYVFTAGDVYEYGDFVAYDFLAIRPALWIEMK